MSVFTIGDRIKLANTIDSVTISDKVADGGQGIIYKVDYDEKTYALKWYLKNKVYHSKAFISNLESNIKNGPPCGNEDFTWPLCLTDRNRGSYGYLMDYIPDSYHQFNKLIYDKVKYKNFKTRITAALNIVRCFRDLHRKGYSYQDISGGNVFINNETGEVQICDNDNVAPHGINLGIAGTPGYVAPEVLLGKHRPDTHTDRYSLAVLLFLLLFHSHPLEGKKAVEEINTKSVEKDLYANNPVFIYNPDDQSNRPAAGIHFNIIRLWPIYPDYIREAFIKSFTEGLDFTNRVKRENRVTDEQWRNLFLKLRDEVIECLNCSNEMITSVALKEGKIHCNRCKAVQPTPLWFKVKKHSIALYPGNIIYSTHIHDNDDHKSVIGKVVSKKDNKMAIGLKNLSQNNWLTIGANGIENKVEPNSVIALQKGLHIMVDSIKTVIE